MRLSHQHSACLLLLPSPCACLRLSHQHSVCLVLLSSLCALLSWLFLALEQGPTLFGAVPPFWKRVLAACDLLNSIAVPSIFTSSLCAPMCFLCGTNSFSTSPRVSGISCCVYYLLRCVKHSASKDQGSSVVLVDWCPRCSSDVSMKGFRSGCRARCCGCFL